MSETRKVEVVYDRECPICEYYCQRVDVAPDIGEMIRVDAREDSPVLDEVTDLGLDIDEGMVVKVDDRIYYGSDAIRKLATVSSRTGFLNRFSYHLFRHSRAARLLYPMLAACRNLLLKILGRTRINNLGLSDNDRF